MLTSAAQHIAEHSCFTSLSANNCALHILQRAHPSSDPNERLVCAPDTALALFAAMLAFHDAIVCMKLFISSHLTQCRV